MDSEQQNLLMELVNDLVNGRYDEILTTQRNGRLSEAEITQALTDYPGTLTLPPKTFLSKAYYYPREGEERLFGSGDVALWYDNEASDLSGYQGLETSEARLSFFSFFSEFVATNNADNFVNLANPSRTRHILDGEIRPNGAFGGGHRSGTGFPSKSEFPAGWSDGQIMHYISDVATDPLSTIRQEEAVISWSSS